MCDISTLEHYCWRCIYIVAIIFVLIKCIEDRLTGNDSNDRWLAAYPNEGGLRNSADYICLIYVCNHFGYPTVERREYNDPQKTSVGDKIDFLFSFLTIVA